MSLNDNNLGYSEKVVNEILNKVVNESVDKVSQDFQIPKEMIYEIVQKNLPKLEQILREDYNKKLENIIQNSKDRIGRTSSTKGKRIHKRLIKECEKIKKKLGNDGLSNK